MTVYAAVDTGSSISIVRLALLDRLGVSLADIQPLSKGLRSVTGEKQMLGKIILKFGLARLEIFYSFWVAEIEEYCPLVLDILDRHDCLN